MTPGPDQRWGMLLVLAGAAVLAVMVVSVNLASLCAASRPVSGCALATSDAVTLASELRHQIAHNPAAADAYVRLLVVAPQSQLDSVVGAAAMVAPTNPNVLLTRARLSLAGGRVVDAVRDLVPLTERYHEQVPQATQVLARLIDAGEIEPLRPYLQPGARWFALVLATMSEAKLPLVRAGPLIGQAGRVGALSTDRLRDLLARLKDNGDWVDAYGLWIAQQGGNVPLLFNGDFEQPFTTGGFDWEVQEGPLGRAGVQVARRRFPARATVLELQFSGRSLQGVPVRQVLFLSPGVYRMSGDFRTEELRTEQGLVWAARCLGSPATLAGRSAPLVDSRGGWSNFDMEIVVPPGCGSVTSLQLETVAPFEAAAGLRGRVMFDKFTLVDARPA